MKSFNQNAEVFKEAFPENLNIFETNWNHNSYLHIQDPMITKLVRMYTYDELLWPRLSCDLLIVSVCD